MPPETPPPDDERRPSPSAEGGNVVDPEVLAERRAQRAEQAEQSAARRAADAQVLAAQLARERARLEAERDAARAEAAAAREGADAAIAEARHLQAERDALRTALDEARTRLVAQRRGAGDPSPSAPALVPPPLAERASAEPASAEPVPAEPSQPAPSSPATSAAEPVEPAAPAPASAPTAATVSAGRNGHAAPPPAWSAALRSELRVARAAAAIVAPAGPARLAPTEPVPGLARERRLVARRAAAAGPVAGAKPLAGAEAQRRGDRAAPVTALALERERSSRLQAQLDSSLAVQRELRTQLAALEHAVGQRIEAERRIEAALRRVREELSAVNALAGGGGAAGAPALTAQPAGPPRAAAGSAAPAATPMPPAPAAPAAVEPPPVSGPPTETGGSSESTASAGSEPASLAPAQAPTVGEPPTPPQTPAPTAVPTPPPPSAPTAGPPPSAALTAPPRASAAETASPVVAPTTETLPPHRAALDPLRLSAARERLRAAAAVAPEVEALPAGPAAPWVTAALQQLLATEPLTAGRIAVGLLPAYGLVAERPLRLDLELPDRGCLALDLAPGRPGTVTARPASRPRGERDLVVAGDAAGVARLLHGRRTLLRRPARVRGGRRTLRELRRLVHAPLGLRELGAAGVALDPALALQLVALAIDAGATQGERFALAHGPLAGGPVDAWLRISDGAAPTVVTQAPPEPTRLTLRCTRGALLALIAGVEPPPGEAGTLDGDERALTLLRGWIARTEQPAT
ncbi:MAG: hypothetical protein JSS99_13015 [Actinobacteria bacterium]|nr:hypothetical protein [Actinomycetota bacterium]